MKISVITPNRNGARFLEQAICSVAMQRTAGLEIEHIVVDGGSTDASLDIVAAHRDSITALIAEPDSGPANAINKGLRQATGDVLCWLNADDVFHPGALVRAAAVLEAHPDKALCFGHCPIIDEEGREIRPFITRFKEMFFPFSSRFTIQCINYVSQPATLFTRAAFEAVGPLREDMTAAWDYEFFLRLWRRGGAVRVARPALAAFRWHEQSISGSRFAEQFREEWEVAVRDAGRYSPQALIHYAVRWGIVWSYRAMARRRARNLRSAGPPTLPEYREDVATGTGGTAAPRSEYPLSNTPSQPARSFAMPEIGSSFAGELPRLSVGVNTLFLIPGEVGGSETYLRRILDAMARGHPEIQLVLFTNRENDGPLRAAFPHVEFVKLDFRASNRYARIVREQIELPSKVRAAGVDVLWSPGYTAPALASCPQAVSILDMQYRRHPGDLTWQARLATDILVRVGVRRCDAVITISEFAGREVLELTSAREKQVHAVPLGVEPAFADDTPAEPHGRRVEELVGATGPYLLSVANSYPHKNLPCLVRAFGELMEDIPHRLVLVGKPRLGEPDLVAELGRLRDTGRVVRIPQVSAGELRALYRGADVFVFPSLYEGFGLPVLEAMMAGTPVVAARVASIPEVAGDCIEYFDHTVEGDLARAIRGVLTLGVDVRRGRVEAARRRAGRFSWETTADRTVAVLRALVERPRR